MRKLRLFQNICLKTSHTKQYQYKKAGSKRNDKTLYITAHPHDERASYSMAAGKAFIESYKEAHPDDEVIHLDLYRENIPQIDADVFSGWGKLQSGSGFEQLSEHEKAKVGRLNELSEQFIAGDKYVFVTPLWNLFSAGDESVLRCGRCSGKDV